jgi:flagellar biosynthesis/type III secretory pathway chaperone
MNAPANPANQSSLESALREVQATLAELLVAADEQYAAVAAHDRERLESVTRQQERLSARLARAEKERRSLLGNSSLNETIADLSGPDAANLDVLRRSIAEAVHLLRTRQAQTAQLLSKSIELGKQTLDFLQRLVTTPGAAYDVRGMVAPRHSVLVDSRA